MENDIRRVRLSAECLGRPIDAEALVFAEGIHVSVYGGDRPHIGAVSVAQPGGEVLTTQFPGHRDAAVSEVWAKAVAGLGLAPVIVEAGIHYDGLDQAGIRSVLAVTDQLLSRLLAALS